MKRKTVTLDAFFRRLRKTRAKWRLTNDLEVRCADGLCPLEKVFGLESGDYCSAPVPAVVRRLVIDAADDSPIRYPVLFRTVRRRLLKACGLSESK